MTKATFVFFIVIIFSCKQRVTKKPQVSLKDSIVAKHLLLIDSLDFYDTTDYDLKILKAYLRNDTVFFKQMSKDMQIAQENWEKYPGPDTCVHLSKLSDLLVDEAYRFYHVQSFCNFGQNITITKRKDTILLHYVEYSFSQDGKTLFYRDKNGKEFHIGPGCEIRKEVHKKLSKQEWMELEHKISLADYWGLKPRIYQSMFDGSSWKIDAYVKEPGYEDNRQIHSVERNPVSPAFIELGKYMLKLSGEKTMCGDFF